MEQKRLGAGMRWLLMACGPMNLGAVAVFAPPFPHLRNMVGLPEARPLYLWVLMAWLPLFGMGYFWMGWSGKASRAFMAVGGAGKATFAVILLALWTNGELPATAGLVGLPDLVLAGVFAAWLWRTR
ncbi:unnamed protein product [Gemmata massiliana]|uniref:Uncharacterized protein n=1 Tax=Gemmata massiliana TaxID=1210884 RepID=A0A6P2CZ43_9BACT|nr:hypothetical protein [Gemmata massiliana]VTR93395.1 unnamed protein product [Gemmata massiliana]